MNDYDKEYDSLFILLNNNTKFNNKIDCCYNLSLYLNYDKILTIKSILFHIFYSSEG